MKKILSSLLAFAMVLALFSGIVIFEASAVEVYMHIPFVNQYTLEQVSPYVSTMLYNSYLGSADANATNVSIAKDAQGRLVYTATTSKNTGGMVGSTDSYHHIIWSTAQTARSRKQTSLIAGIDPFGDAELSNKTKLVIKFGFDDAGYTAWGKKSAYFYFASSQTVAYVIKSGVGATYSDSKKTATFTCDLTSMSYSSSGNTGSVKSLADAFDGVLDSLIIDLRFGNAAEPTEVKFWIEDVYLVGPANTVNLHKAIREAKTAGVDQALIDEAEAVYKDTASTQTLINNTVAKLEAAMGTAAYNYYALTGFTATTQAELDLLSGNVGYVDGAIYNAVTSKLELTDKPGEIKLTTNPANNQKYNQSIVTYKKADGSTLASNPWAPVDTTVDLSTLDGIRFKLTDADGKPVSYYGNYRFVNSAKGWADYWMYLGKPDIDADGYNVIDFGRVRRVKGNSYDNTQELFVDQLKTINAISFLIYSAADTLYFSDMQAYKRNVTRDYGMDILDLPGFSDWTADNITAANAVAAMDGNNAYSAFEFYDKAYCNRGNAVHGLLPTKDYKPNNYTQAWHTRSSTDNEAAQQNGDVFGSINTVADFLKYDGIRVGIAATDGSDPITYSWDGSHVVNISFALRGSGQHTFDNKWYTPFTAQYSTASGQLFPTYEDGYVYFYFKDFKSWGDYVMEDYDPSKLNQAYGNFVMTYVAGGCNTEWKRLVVSDMQLFRKHIDDPTEGLWEYNYTAESWKALTDAYEARDEEAIAAAKAALKPAVTMAVTEDFFKGWTTEDVNAVVTTNSTKLCDSIGDGLNTQNVWNGGDFSNNTTFAMENGAFTMTATADFTGKSMGWKNMDRSGTLNTGKVSTGDAGRDYPYMAANVKGLSEADGIRFKLNVSDSGSFERLLIGLSNCDDFVREQYALKLTKDNFDADGYINIPFSAFEKAWWCSAFTQAELEQVLVFIVEAYGVTNGTKISISDLHGYTVATKEKIIGDLWQYNYTAESWAPLAAAAEALDLDAAAAAKAALVPVKTARVTGNLMEGWTTANVNATVTANSGKLCDSIGEGLNINNAWNAGDFSNNTTFEADSNLSLTATADFTGKAMGWKNMDRSKTLQNVTNGAFPALNVAGLKDAEGIRFKLESNKPIERILIGLSTCAEPSPFATGGHREMYAMKIKPENVGADGYINIPWSYFEAAFWSQKFAQDELDQTIVFIIEAYGAENGTKLTISDLHGYITRDFDDSDLANVWEYNYTPESYKAYSDAIRVAKTAAERDAAFALLVPANVKTVTEDFFKGWTTEDVNAVVNTNNGRLCDSIGDGLNTNGKWNGGDFSKNTTFAMENGAFTMTATADFTGKAMGWKNMDRSGTLNTNKVSTGDAGRDYPFMAANVKGLSKAEGIRFKLESNKPVERILIGLSNCDDFVREQYALKIKPEYVAADGYINVPFSYFEKAWWCSAFSQAELEQVLVFIVEAYGAEEGTKIAISDVRGYKTIVAPTQAEIDALSAAITKLEGYDFDAKYTDLIADAKAQLTAVDEDYVLDATAAVLAVTDKLDAADRSALKANIDAVKAIDATLWATEIAAGVDAYYNLDAAQSDIDAAAKVLKRIIDKPETPTVTAASVTDTTIEVVAIRGAKYKLNDGEWQDSNVFENLLPNKAYAISAYIVETEDFIASDVSVAVEITTAKGSFGTATVTLSGTERYNEVLTATAADVPEYLGEYAIEWRNAAGETVGTGATYTVAAADIGSFVYAVLVSANAGDTVASDPTGTIGKGVIKGYTLPTASEIMYPQTLADSVLSGADTGIVTGTWAWVAPTTQPLSTQSGSAFEVTFTPDANFIDLYEIITAKVTVTINPAPYEPQTFVSTQDDLTVEGEFMQNTEMKVEEIDYKQPSYLSLLRASAKDTSGLKKLILFKDISFTVNGEELDDMYEGKLTVKSFVGLNRAGQTYSVWFFVDGASVNYVGTVDANGILVVEDVIL
ncbi:MAG: hypothetical protein J5756_05100 [Clostridia bacterium]|nr:hypothetical protein [Clostridia bacterium]